MKNWAASPFLILCFVGLWSGCASVDFSSLRKVDKSLNFIRFSVIKSLPNGKETADISGRRFLSNPFLYKYGKFVPASNSRFRYRAVVYIRGDSRPYTLEIWVYSEQRENKVFKKKKYYRSLAQNLSQTIQEKLSKSLDSMNVVDDLKAL